MKIEVGGIYENEKGLQRKVVGFRGLGFGQRNMVVTTGTAEGRDIVYEVLNGRNVGKTKACWVGTFRSWSKRRVDTTSEELVPVPRAEYEALRALAEGIAQLDHRFVRLADFTTYTEKAVDIMANYPERK